jgi:hypothetical protein
MIPAIRRGIRSPVQTYILYTPQAALAEISSGEWAQSFYILMQFISIKKE